jgi:hypothetical protein
MESAAALAVGDFLVVDMPEAGAVAAEVIWIRDGFAGCEFDRPVSTAAVSAALLQSIPQQCPSVAESVPVVARNRPIASGAEPEWIKTAAIVALIVASGIATLFIVALLNLPFAVS